MRPPGRHVRRGSLGLRLIGLVMLFTVLLSLLITAGQLVLESRWEVKAIEERLSQVERSYARSLAHSLWSFDEALLRTQLEGILHLPDIRYLELETSYGERYTAGTPPAHGDTLTRTFPLRHTDGRQVELGTFRVVADLSGVHHRVRERSLMILGVQAAKTVLISGFLLVLFQYLVTRHLGTMAAYARNLRLAHLDRPLVLHRKARGGAARDELAQVTQSINEMRVSLRAEMAERRRVELANHFLAEASRQLATSLEYQVVADCICRLAVPELADLSVLHEVDPDGTVRPVALAASSPDKAALAGELLRHEPLALDVRVRGRAALTAEPSVPLRDVETSEEAGLAAARPQRRVLQALGCRTLTTLPLEVHGLRYGVLVLMRLEGAPGCHGPTDGSLLEELGRRAATALANAHLYRESRKAVRMRDEFLTVAAHELNTPLTPLRLHARQLARLSEQPGEEASFRQTVRRLALGLNRQIDRLQQLARMLLDVSQLQTGQLTLHREEVDLAALAREVLAGLEGPLAVAGCPVELRAEEGVLGRWDRQRVAQVVTGLLHNAMKFGARGPIRVRVCSRHGQARLTVTDEGMGISREDQSRIFERFTRAVSERHFGGLGLGLFIAQRIAEAHEGRIRVESEPGAGATFIVELPLLRGAHVDPGAPRPEAPPG